MTPLHLLRRLAAVAILTAALLPGGSASAAPDPYHCAAPTSVGDGGGIHIALDRPSGPVPPGTAQALGIHVTNVNSVPTADPTLVVVHNFVPNTFTAAGGLTLTDFATGVSYTVPAGLGPGVTASASLLVKLGASIPPRTTEHCDVTAFSGADRATAAYDVTTGDPVVHLEAAMLPASGRPGETVRLGMVVGNAGPSNEYTGPAVFTIRAPSTPPGPPPPATAAPRTPPPPP